MFKVNSVIRETVWRNTYGSALDAICLICDRTPLSAFHFECGHVVARAHGGSIHPDNLRAICGRCNRSMGTKHMDEYLAGLGKPAWRPAPIPNLALVCKEFFEPGLYAEALRECMDHARLCEARVEPHLTCRHLYRILRTVETVRQALRVPIAGHKKGKIRELFEAIRSAGVQAELQAEAQAKLQAEALAEARAEEQAEEQLSDNLAALSLLSRDSPSELEQKVASEPTAKAASPKAPRLLFGIEPTPETCGLSLALLERPGVTEVVSDWQMSPGGPIQTAPSRLITNASKSLHIKGERIIFASPGLAYRGGVKTFDGITTCAFYQVEDGKLSLRVPLSEIIAVNFSKSDHMLRFILADGGMSYAKYMWEPNRVAEYLRILRIVIISR